MTRCNGPDCYYGYGSVVNPQAGEISGSYRTFVEAMSFIIFAVGVTLNTGVLTVLIAAYPNLDSFDGFLMNLSFGELMSSFSLAFVLFVEFTSTMAPIGDGGCRFLTWLDLTSVTITITTLVAATYDLHQRIYYANTNPLSRRRFIGCLLGTWLVASLPGFPYMATAKMENNYCHIAHWSHDAEILYICAMIFFQIIIPLAVLMFFFVRMILALRVSMVGGTILTEEGSNPGSEVNFQRACLKRKLTLLILITGLFYLVLVVVSLVQLSLALNIGNIEDNPVRYRRIREANSLFECIKCLFVPLVYICFYEKFQRQSKRMFCCRRNEEVYNSLNLRYSVYQQTVQETPTEQNGNTTESVDQLTLANEELYETERDDVAILKSS